MVQPSQGAGKRTSEGGKGPKPSGSPLLFWYLVLTLI
jgi:hypothetical protein